MVLTIRFVSQHGELLLYGAPCCCSSLLCIWSRAERNKGWQVSLAWDDFWNLIILSGLPHNSWSCILKVKFFCKPVLILVTVVVFSSNWVTLLLFFLLLDCSDAINSRKHLSIMQHNPSCSVFAISLFLLISPLPLVVRCINYTGFFLSLRNVFLKLTRSTLNLG